MSTPVTEVVILSFQPGTSAEEPLQALKAILSRQDGFSSMKYGLWEEDKDKVQLMISTSATPPLENWKDITYHKKFEQSGADYDAVGSVLGPVLAAPPTMYHVNLEHATQELVLNAPFVELATFFSVPQDFKENATEFLELVGSSPGCGGIAHGNILEEISRAGSDVQEGAYFAALGWVSIEAHMEAVKRDVVQDKMNLVFGERGAKEIEMHHVRFNDA